MQQRAGPGCPAALTAQPLQAASSGHRDLQGTPHSVFPRGRITRDFFMLVLPRAAGVSESVCKTFSACLLLCSSLEPCDICFSIPSESLCGCHRARFQHVTVSDVQLHLYPCRLQGGTEQSLSWHCLDKHLHLHHSITCLRAKNPSYIALRISFCWCPCFNWVC